MTVFARTLWTVIFTLSQGVFVYAAESNFWEQRRRAAEMKGYREPAAGDSRESSQLAQMSGAAMNTQMVTQGLPAPSSVTPALFESAVLKDLPASQKTEDWAPWLSMLSQEGTVRGIQWAKGNPQTAPWVIYIQDVHGHADAQKNIAAMILKVLEKNPKTLVALEGAAGDVDTDWFRSPDLEANKIAGGLFLEAGMIGGPEFAAFAAPAAPRLFGMENEDLYLKHAASVKESLPQQPELLQALKTWEGRLNDQKAQVFSPALKTLDEKMAARHAANLSLGDYLGFLTEGTPELNLYPNLSLYHQAWKIETRLDFAAVERQRNGALKEMVGRLPKSEIEKFMQMGVAFRLGKVSYTDFYAFLKTMGNRARLNWAEYPQFEKYLQYIAQADAIRPEILIKEITQLEKHAARRRIQNNIQRDLFDKVTDLRLLYKLATLSLTTDEWTEYRSRQADIHRFFNAAFDDGAKKEFQMKLRDRTALLAPFERFYTYAEARNDALADNLFEKARGAEANIQNESLEMVPGRETRPAPESALAAPLAVLVAGGFHSIGLTALLNKKGVTIVTVSPKFSVQTAGLSDNDYLHTFTRDRTPLEKLFASPKISINMTLITKPIGGMNPGEDMFRGIADNVMEAAAAARIQGIGESAQDLPEGGDLVCRVENDAVDHAPAKPLRGANVLEIKSGEYKLTATQTPASLGDRTLKAAAYFGEVYVEDVLRPVLRRFYDLEGQALPQLFSDILGPLNLHDTVAQALGRGLLNNQGQREAFVDALLPHMGLLSVTEFIFEAVGITRMPRNYPSVLEERLGAAERFWRQSIPGLEPFSIRVLSGSSRYLRGAGLHHLFAFTRDPQGRLTILVHEDAIREFTSGEHWAERDPINRKLRSNQDEFMKLLAIFNDPSQQTLYVKTDDAVLQVLLIRAVGHEILEARGYSHEQVEEMGFGPGGLQSTTNMVEAVKNAPGPAAAAAPETPAEQKPEPPSYFGEEYAEKVLRPILRRFHDAQTGETHLNIFTKVLIPLGIGASIANGMVQAFRTGGDAREAFVEALLPHMALREVTEYVFNAVDVCLTERPSGGSIAAPLARANEFLQANLPGAPRMRTRVVDGRADEVEGADFHRLFSFVRDPLGITVLVHEDIVEVFSPTGEYAVEFLEIAARAETKAFAQRQGITIDAAVLHILLLRALGHELLEGHGVSHEEVVQLGFGANGLQAVEDIVRVLRQRLGIDRMADAYRISSADALPSFLNADFVRPLVAASRGLERDLDRYYAPVRQFIDVQMEKTRIFFAYFARPLSYPKRETYGLAGSLLFLLGTGAVLLHHSSSPLSGIQLLAFLLPIFTVSVGLVVAAILYGSYLTWDVQRGELIDPAVPDDDALLRARVAGLFHQGRKSEDMTIVNIVSEMVSVSEETFAATIAPGRAASVLRDFANGYWFNPEDGALYVNTPFMLTSWRYVNNALYDHGRKTLFVLRNAARAREFWLGCIVAHERGKRAYFNATAPLRGVPMAPEWMIWFRLWDKKIAELTGNVFEFFHFIAHYAARLAAGRSVPAAPDYVPAYNLLEVLPRLAPRRTTPEPSRFLRDAAAPTPSGWRPEILRTPDAPAPVPQLRNIPAAPREISVRGGAVSLAPSPRRPARLSDGFFWFIMATAALFPGTILLLTQGRAAWVGWFAVILAGWAAVVLKAVYDLVSPSARTAVSAALAAAQKRPFLAKVFKISAAGVVLSVIGGRPLAEALADGDGSVPAAIALFLAVVGFDKMGFVRRLFGGRSDDDQEPPAPGADGPSGPSAGPDIAPGTSVPAASPILTKWILRHTGLSQNDVILKYAPAVESTLMWAGTLFSLAALAAAFTPGVGFVSSDANVGALIALFGTSAIGIFAVYNIVFGFLFHRSVYRYVSIESELQKLVREITDDGDPQGLLRAQVDQLMELTNAGQTHFWREEPSNVHVGWHLTGKSVKVHGVFFVTGVLTAVVYIVFGSSWTLFGLGAVSNLVALAASIMLHQANNLKAQQTGDVALAVPALVKGAAQEIPWHKSLSNRLINAVSDGISLDDILKDNSFWGPENLESAELAAAFAEGVEASPLVKDKTLVGSKAVNAYLEALSGQVLSLRLAKGRNLSQEAKDKLKRSYVEEMAFLMDLDFGKPSPVDVAKSVVNRFLFLARLQAEKGAPWIPDTQDAILGQFRDSFKKIDLSPELTKFLDDATNLNWDRKRTRELALHVLGGEPDPNNVKHRTAVKKIEDQPLVAFNYHFARQLLSNPQFKLLLSQDPAKRVFLQQIDKNNGVFSDAVPAAAPAPAAPAPTDERMRLRDEDLGRSLVRFLREQGADINHWLSEDYWIETIDQPEMFSFSQAPANLAEAARAVSALVAHYRAVLADTKWNRQGQSVADQISAAEKNRQMAHYIETAMAHPEIPSVDALMNSFQYNYYPSRPLKANEAGAARSLAEKMAELAGKVKIASLDHASWFSTLAEYNRLAAGWKLSQPVTKEEWALLKDYQKALTLFDDRFHPTRPIEGAQVRNYFEGLQRLILNDLDAVASAAAAVAPGARVPAAMPAVVRTLQNSYLLKGLHRAVTGKTLMLDDVIVTYAPIVESLFLSLAKVASAGFLIWNLQDYSLWAQGGAALISYAIWSAVFGFRGHPFVYLSHPATEERRLQVEGEINLLKSAPSVAEYLANNWDTSYQVAAESNLPDVRRYIELTHELNALAQALKAGEADYWILVENTSRRFYFSLFGASLWIHSPLLVAGLGSLLVSAKIWIAPLLAAGVLISMGLHVLKNRRVRGRGKPALAMDRRSPKSREEVQAEMEERLAETRRRAAEEKEALGHDHLKRFADELGTRYSEPTFGHRPLAEWAQIFKRFSATLQDDRGRARYPKGVDIKLMESSVRGEVTLGEAIYLMRSSRDYPGEDVKGEPAGTNTFEFLKNLQARPIQGENNVVIPVRDWCRLFNMLTDKAPHFVETDEAGNQASDYIGALNAWRTTHPAIFSDEEIRLMANWMVSPGTVVEEIFDGIESRAEARALNEPLSVQAVKRFLTDEFLRGPNFATLVGSYVKASRPTLLNAIVDAPTLERQMRAALATPEGRGRFAALVAHPREAQGAISRLVMQETVAPVDAVPAADYYPLVLYFARYFYTKHHGPTPGVREPRSGGSLSSDAVEEEYRNWPVFIRRVIIAPAVEWGILARIMWARFSSLDGIANALAREFVYGKHSGNKVKVGLRSVGDIRMSGVENIIALSVFTAVLAAGVAAVYLFANIFIPTWQAPWGIEMMQWLVTELGRGRGIAAAALVVLAGALMVWVLSLGIGIYAFHALHNIIYLRAGYLTADAGIPQSDIDSVLSQLDKNSRDGMAVVNLQEMWLQAAIRLALDQTKTLGTLMAEYQAVKESDRIAEFRRKGGGADPFKEARYRFAIEARLFWLSQGLQNPRPELTGGAAVVRTGVYGVWLPAADGQLTVHIGPREESGKPYMAVTFYDASGRIPVSAPVDLADDRFFAPGSAALGLWAKAAPESKLAAGLRPESPGLWRAILAEKEGALRQVQVAATPPSTDAELTEEHARAQKIYSELMAEWESLMRPLDEKRQEAQREKLDGILGDYARAVSVPGLGRNGAWAAAQNLIIRLSTFKSTTERRSSSGDASKTNASRMKEIKRILEGADRQPGLPAVVGETWPSLLPYIADLQTRYKSLSDTADQVQKAVERDQVVAEDTFVRLTRDLEALRVDAVTCDMAAHRNRVNTNFYTLLGLTPFASLGDIAAAAEKYKPSGQHFSYGNDRKEIEHYHYAAIQVLTNPFAKRFYDAIRALRPAPQVISEMKGSAAVRTTSHREKRANEDFVSLAPAEDKEYAGRLLLLADGMSGLTYSYGDVASQFAVETAERFIRDAKILQAESIDAVEKIVNAAFVAANQAVLAEKVKNPIMLGTTLVLAVLWRDPRNPQGPTYLIGGSVGDSPLIIKKKDGRLVKGNQSDSQGNDELASHIGSSKFQGLSKINQMPHVSKQTIFEELEEGDIVIAMSDGASDNLPYAGIKAAAGKSDLAGEIAENIVNAAFDVSDSGEESWKIDDITVAVISEWAAKPETPDPGSTARFAPPSDVRPGARITFLNDQNQFVALTVLSIAQNGLVMMTDLSVDQLAQRPSFENVNVVFWDLTYINNNMRTPINPNGRLAVAAWSGDAALLRNVERAAQTVADATVDGIRVNLYQPYSIGTILQDSVISYLIAQGFAEKAQGVEGDFYYVKKNHYHVHKNRAFKEILSVPIFLWSQPVDRETLLKMAGYDLAQNTPRLQLMLDTYPPQVGDIVIQGQKVARIVRINEKGIKIEHTDSSGRIIGELIPTSMAEYRQLGDPNSGVQHYMPLQSSAQLYYAGKYGVGSLGFWIGNSIGTVWEYVYRVPLIMGFVGPALSYLTEKGILPRGFHASMGVPRYGKTVGLAGSAFFFLGIFAQTQTAMIGGLLIYALSSTYLFTYAHPDGRPRSHVFMSVITGFVTAAAFGAMALAMRDSLLPTWMLVLSPVLELVVHPALDAGIMAVTNRNILEAGLRGGLRQNLREAGHPLFAESVRQKVAALEAESMTTQGLNDVVSRMENLLGKPGPQLAPIDAAASDVVTRHSLLAVAERLRARMLLSEINALPGVLTRESMRPAVVLEGASRPSDEEGLSPDAVFALPGKADRAEIEELQRQGHAARQKHSFTAQLKRAEADAKKSAVRRVLVRARNFLEDIFLPRIFVVYAEELDLVTVEWIKRAAEGRHFLSRTRYALQASRSGMTEQEFRKSLSGKLAERGVSQKAVDRFMKAAVWHDTEADQPFARDIAGAVKKKIYGERASRVNPRIVFWTVRWDVYAFTEEDFTDPLFTIEMILNLAGDSYNPFEEIFNSLEAILAAARAA